MTYYEPTNHRTLFGLGVVWYVGIAAVIFVTLVVVFAIRWQTAPVRGKLQAREQIQSGNFRIQAYDHFFDLCASVQTMDQALNQTYQDLRTAPKNDRVRISTNATAQLNSRNDAANQYNQDSHKGYTVGQFKSSNLPFEIAPYQKGQVISCAI